MKPHAAVFLLFCAFPFVVALLVGTPLMAVLPWVVASAFVDVCMGVVGALLWPGRTPVRLSTAGAIFVLLSGAFAFVLWLTAVGAAFGVGVE